MKISDTCVDSSSFKWQFYQEFLFLKTASMLELSYVSIWLKGHLGIVMFIILIAGGFKGIYICHDYQIITHFKLHVFIAYQWNLKNRIYVVRYVFQDKNLYCKIIFKVCHLFFISLKIYTVCLLLSRTPRHIYFKKDRWNHGDSCASWSLDIGP